MMKKGFTLIEILVVLSIISMLSAIGILNFNKARIKGRDAKRKVDLGTIQSGLENYYDDARVYPGSLSALVPTYMPLLPTDPKTNTNYVYWQSGANDKYAVNTLLENDAELDTPGLVVDITGGLCYLPSANSPYVSGVCTSSGKKIYQVSSGG